MGTETGIAWTDHTFNPWMGCQRVSEGCQHCYAETLVTGRMGKPLWGAKADRQVTSDANWRLPHRWNRDAEAAGRPARVFCASLADVFEARDDLVEPRERLFDMIEATPHLVWQLLTKRPENVAGMVPARWLYEANRFHRDGSVAFTSYGWPSNVWIGTTCENQQRADERLPHLCELPAPVRFVSAEPLLGPVDLWDYLTPYAHTLAMAGVPGETMPSRFVDWVIVGGESGAGHRPMDLDHARSLRTQCETAEVPMFFKQVGGQHPKSGGVLLDGELIQQFPEAASR